MPSPEEIEQVQSDNMEAMGFPEGEVVSYDEAGKAHSDSLAADMTDSEREMLEDIGYMPPGEHPSDEARRRYEEAMELVSEAHTTSRLDAISDRVEEIKKDAGLPTNPPKRRDSYRPGVGAYTDSLFKKRKY